MLIPGGTGRLFSVPEKLHEELPPGTDHLRILPHALLQQARQVPRGLRNFVVRPVRVYLHHQHVTCSFVRQSSVRSGRHGGYIHPTISPLIHVNLVILVIHVIHAWS